MSRTLKDRPYWVLKNDPTMERYASHNHLALQTELMGEEPVYHTKWGMEEQLWYIKRLYKRWYEPVDCTLDIPEGPVSTWRVRSPRTATNEDRLADKNCYWNLEYYPNIRSNKDNKRFTNKALRHKVNVKLGQIERDFGQWLDPRDYLQDLGVDATLEDIWEAQAIDPYAIDIVDETKYITRGWWD